MIVVFGSINMDFIAAVLALPHAGQTLLATAARLEPGGKGANQAVAAARAGGAVAMAGAVGRDALAEAALSGLRAAGVDIERVARVDALTGFATIAVDARGENQIIVAPGANLLAPADQVEDAVLTRATTLLLQMETDLDETARLIGRARRRGARIMLNLAPARAIDPALFAALDVLVVNEDEAAFVARQHACAADAETLSRTLGIIVVRTLGAQGAEAAGPGWITTVAAEQVDVLDTVGAGDSFTGTLAAALHQGLGWPDALRQASRAASICCGHLGSQR